MTFTPRDLIGSILFDLDGTLLDTAVNITIAINLLRDQRGYGQVEVNTVRRSVSLGARELMRACLGEALGDMEDDLRAFRTVLGDLSSSASDLYEGVVATLDAIPQCVSLAVVTNKPEDLAIRLLDDLKIAGRFKTIVGCDTTPEAKPSPLPIIYALGELNCRPESALMVGDSDLDAVAAKAAGCRFALFTSGYGPRLVAAELAHFQFATFPALAEAVSREFAKESVSH